jgi:hypothetical protein
MNLIGWTAVVSAIHDGWTFSAFVLLLLYMQKQR